MARELGDWGNEACQIDILQRVERGELDPAIVLEAFGKAREGFLAGKIGNAGAWLVRTIQGMVAASVTAEELLEVHDTLPMPPAKGVSGPVDHSEPNSEELPPPGAYRAHWVEGIQAKVMALLEEQAGMGPLADGQRLEKVAVLVQEQLVGRYAGNASKLYLALAEAVAFGYPITSVGTLLEIEAGKHDPSVRIDIKDSIRYLDPDPRDWLKRNVSVQDRFFDLSRRPSDALVR